MLGISIGGRTTMGVLEERTENLNDLLRRIPTDTDLWAAAAPDIDHDSPAEELWKQLKHIDGVGSVVAGKLLARKRPQLIPIWGDVVGQAIGEKYGWDWWILLREALQDGARLQRLWDLRAEAGIGEGVSLLRTLDVSIWMTRDEPLVTRPAG